MHFHCACKMYYNTIRHILLRDCRDENLKEGCHVYCVIIYKNANERKCWNYVDDGNDHMLL